MKTIFGALVVAAMLCASSASADEEPLPNKEVAPGPLPEVAPPLPVPTETVQVVPPPVVVVQPPLPLTCPNGCGPQAPLHPVFKKEDAIQQGFLPPPYDPHKLRMGFGMDFGAPGGINAGFVVHPKLDWLSTEISFSYLIAPGGRLSVQLDPFALMPKLAVGLFADFQGGFMARGSIPVETSKLPSVGYDYFNAYGGLRFGSVNNFHWFFEAGPSFLHVSTSDFQKVVGSVPKGLVIGNPSADMWALPTFQTGFQVIWP